MAKTWRLVFILQMRWPKAYYHKSNILISRTSESFRSFDSAPFMSSPPISSSSSVADLGLDIPGIPPDIQQLLRTLPFFTRARAASISDVDVAIGTEEFLGELATAMHIRHFAAGDVIIKEGEVAKAMFFVVKGTVKVISEDGEINFAELNPGSFCKFLQCYIPSLSAYSCPNETNNVYCFV